MERDLSKFERNPRTQFLERLANMLRDQGTYIKGDQMLEEDERLLQMGVLYDIQRFVSCYDEESQVLQEYRGLRDMARPELPTPKQMMMWKLRNAAKGQYQSLLRSTDSEERKREEAEVIEAFVKYIDGYDENIRIIEAYKREHPEEFEPQAKDKDEEDPLQL